MCVSVCMYVVFKMPFCVCRERGWWRLTFRHSHRHIVERWEMSAKLTVAHETLEASQKYPTCYTMSFWSFKDKTYCLLFYTYEKSCSLVLFCFDQS